METAKIFENGKSQAVRLPKAYRLKGRESYITNVGDAIISLLFVFFNKAKLGSD